MTKAETEKYNGINVIWDPKWDCLPVLGKLYFENNGRVFVCQNEYEGCDCGCENRFPYAFSYAYDFHKEYSFEEILIITKCTVAKGIYKKKFSI